ncbi:MAG: glycosyltransferase family 2 protein [Xanthomonadales bacterium]|nr:glycosyltransferase family 2 protein [Xanthomonadales bacterium]
MSGRLVSVVMPMYNAERFLRRPVESVLAQSHGDLELVVVDDGSRDGSVALVEDYARRDPRVRLIRSLRNGGVAAARNQALDAASGRYVAFLDSDDWWEPDKLAIQLAVLQAGPAALTYSAYQRVAEDGSPLGVVRPPDELDHARLLRSNHIGNCTALYDRQRIGSEPRFQRIGHEDYVFWLALLRGGARAVRAGDGRPLAWYLVRDGSQSANKLRAAGWQWRIYRDIEAMGVIRSGWHMLHYVRHALAKRR